MAECGEVCCDEDETCDTQLDQCVPCTPDCADKACGADNGCGYECDGSCSGANQFCPTYAGDGCLCLYSACDSGEVCCGENETCDLASGLCVMCTPDCADAACGDPSECGYPCDGTCADGETCVAGACE